MQLTSIKFKFNREKAIEVILYLAQKLPKPNEYGICKSLYLADKLSLKKYGRFLFGESYVAMNQGATPSNVYDIIKDLRANPTDELKIENHVVIPLRQSETDYLSNSDIECIEQIIAEYSDPSDFEKRKKACHDKAYQKAWDKKGTKKSAPITVESIAELFPDSEKLIDYLTHSG
jgi:uncharacterized phage-associated protein